MVPLRDFFKERLQTIIFLSSDFLTDISRPLVDAHPTWMKNGEFHRSWKRRKDKKPRRAGRPPEGNLFPDCRWAWVETWERDRCYKGSVSLSVLSSGCRRSLLIRRSLWD